MSLNYVIHFCLCLSVEPHPEPRTFVSSMAWMRLGQKQKSPHPAAIVTLVSFMDHLDCALNSTICMVCFVCFLFLLAVFLMFFDFVGQSSSNQSVV